MGDAYIGKGIGISCMSVIALSYGLCQLMCSQRGMCFACRVLAITCFFPYFWGSATLTKLNTEMCICHTFGIVTLIYSENLQTIFSMIFRLNMHLAELINTTIYVFTDI